MTCRGLAGSSAPPILSLIEWLEANNEKHLAERLKPNWAFLAQRPIAIFALHTMDFVGRTYARLLRKWS